MPKGPKLRYRADAPPFRVALVDPEIPQNTGSIARTCVATNSELHLVGKLGFDISERAVRRAGLDYWPHLQLSRFEDSDAYLDALRPDRTFLLTSGAGRSYLEADFEPGDTLVFGCESQGLPPHITARFESQVHAIPTFGHVRSLNLSNAVSIVLFEALRVTGQLQDTHLRT